MDLRAHDRRGGAGAGEARVLTPDERDVPTGAAALAKGLYLLDVIGEAPAPPRFRDLQAATGLPKGTLARMLNTLLTFRLIRHEESDNTYRLGHRLFELAHRVWESFDLRGAGAPALDRLAEETRETAALCAIDNGEVLYIDQRSRGGPYGFRIEIGRRAPLHCTAGGKALLAFVQPHEQRALVDRLKLERFTETTITEEEALAADLALTRARGYAVSQEEHVAGVASVAAPIFDHTGRAVAAIGVFGPSSRLTRERLHTTGRDLMAAARQISGNVGATQMNISPAPRSARPVDPDVQCVLPWGAHLAEGPYWSAGEQRLYWVDILAPSVNRFDPATGNNEEVTLPRLVSAVLGRRGGGLVVLTQEGLEGFDFASGRLTPLADPEADIPDNRFKTTANATGRAGSGPGRCGLTPAAPRARSTRSRRTSPGSGRRAGSPSPTGSTGARTGGASTSSIPPIAASMPTRSTRKPARSPIAASSPRSPDGRTGSRSMPRASSGARSGMAGACTATPRTAGWIVRSGCRCRARPASPSAGRT